MGGWSFVAPFLPDCLGGDGGRDEEGWDLSSWGATDSIPASEAGTRDCGAPWVWHVSAQPPWMGQRQFSPWVMVNPFPVPRGMTGNCSNLTGYGESQRKDPWGATDPDSILKDETWRRLASRGGARPITNPKGHGGESSSPRGLRQRRVYPVGCHRS